MNLKQEKEIKNKICPILTTRYPAGYANCTSSDCALWLWSDKDICENCKRTNQCLCNSKQPKWIKVGYCGLIKQ